MSRQKKRDDSKSKRARGGVIAGLTLLALLALLARKPAEDYPPAERHSVSTEKPQVCLHTLLENEVEDESILRSLELVRELGGTTIVQFFPWAYVEREPGRYSWTLADRIVRQADMQGLRVIGRLGLVPDWARDGNTETLNYLTEELYPDFADYAAAFAERYAGSVDRLIIWNEPNLSFEWGYQPVDPARYVRLLEASYAPIKQANPSAVVLAGALAPTLERKGSSAGLNELDFLQAMYDLGAGEYFDALAIHSYGFQEPPEAEPAPDRLNFRRSELLRDIMLENDDGHKPVTITESGWNDHARWTQAVRPSQRSAYTVRAFQYAEQKWQWLENLCIWALRYPADVYSYPDNFTLVTSGFVEKPIYFALQDYARGWAKSETPWLPPPRADE